MAVFAALGLPVGVVGSACSQSGGGGAGSGGGGGATTGGGSSAGGGGSGGGISHPLAKCGTSTPIMDKEGAASGYVKCEDGSVDRVKPVGCDDAVPACTGDEDAASCVSDADCPAHSRCGHHDTGRDEIGCDCIAVCSTDADCDANEACVCAGVFPHVDIAECRKAACTSPSDCPSGECGLDIYDYCDAQPSLSCRDLEKDACRTDAQCDKDQCTGLWVGATSRTCTFQGCDGRLLRDEIGLVVAAATDRSDWIAGRTRSDGGLLPVDLRRALAEHWTRVAETEHAAVASFARFTLQLLAVSAPPELLEAAQRAASEEIEHARRAFAIASGFAGRAIGPGPLDAGGLPLSTTRMGLIEGLIDDACVSELVNVAEVQAIAAIATDAAVREFAARTALEEEAHVALAWRVLRWALEGASFAERAAARTRLEARIADLAAGYQASAFSAPAHGVLASSERLAIRRLVLGDVAGPAVKACFANLGAPAPTETELFAS